MPKSKRMQPWLSLAKIMSDSDLAPEVFTNCLLEAWRSGKAVMGSLRIENRSGPDGETIFLFTVDDKIAGQFPLDPSFLKKPLTIQRTIRYALGHLVENGGHLSFRKKWR